jgi:NTE family protein
MCIRRKSKSRPARQRRKSPALVPYTAVRPSNASPLVLQGGGALGAYQAGVYEAGVYEAGLEPDWVAGISIGSINAAIIAGNPPKTRVDMLRSFWEGITDKPWSPVFPMLQ